MRFVQVRSEMTQMRMTVRTARLARLEVTEVILTILSRVTHCPCLEQQDTPRLITSLRLLRKYLTELRSFHMLVVCEVRGWCVWCVVCVVWCPPSDWPGRLPQPIYIAV